MKFARVQHFLSLVVFAASLTGCAATAPERIVVFPPAPDEPRFQWVGTYHSERDFKRVGMEKVLSDLTGDGPVNGFDGPMGVSVADDGTVLVSDTYAQTVKFLDLKKGQIGFFGNYRFRTNLGLATDRQGRVYVADGPARQVLVFAADGTPLSVIGGEEHFEKPAFLAINHELGRLYVSDAKAYDVKVFSLDGEFLMRFGGKGGDLGQFNVPQGVAIAADGRVFVADMFNARIQVFSADGEYLESFGGRGTLKNQFETPKGLAFDSEGNLYVVDSRRPNFRVFKPDGTLLLVIGGEKRSNHKLSFVLPVAIHVGPFDRVFVSDLMGGRVTVWQYLSEAYRARQAAKAEQKD